MGWNIGDIANNVRQWAGNTVDEAATGYELLTGQKAPRIGASEWLAGGNTTNTGRVKEGTQRSAVTINNPQYGGGGGAPSPDPAPQFDGGSVEQIYGNSGGGGGYYSGGGSSYNAAAAAEAANLERKRNSLRTSQNGYRDAANQNVLDVNNTYDNNNKTTLSALKGTQDEINTGQSNNALNLIRSMSTIANGVRTGLKSGGVQLADMGATDSGAADALARAYATMGNQQVSDANNEAALVKNELDTKQTTFNREKDDKINGLNSWRDTELSRIRNDLHSKLTLLDASGQENGVNGVVDYGIVDQIVNDAVAKLQGVDAMRNQRLAEVHGLSQGEVNAKAADMNKAGIDTGTSPFLAGQEGINTTVSQPGVATSQTPLFNTLNKKDDGSTTNTDVLLKKKLTA